MIEEETLENLRRENERLQHENETMKKIIDQLRNTLNRMIIHFIEQDKTGKSA